MWQCIHLVSSAVHEINFTDSEFSCYQALVQCSCELHRISTYFLSILTLHFILQVLNLSRFDIRQSRFVHQWIHNQLRFYCSLDYPLAPPPLTRPPADKKMPCYAVHCIVPSPRLPAVELHEEGETSCIRYKGDMMKINSEHLKKLVSTNFGSLSPRLPAVEPHEEWETS